MREWLLSSFGGILSVGLLSFTALAHSKNYLRFIYERSRFFLQCFVFVLLYKCRNVSVVTCSVKLVFWLVCVVIVFRLVSHIESAASVSNSSKLLPPKSSSNPSSSSSSSRSGKQFSLFSSAILALRDKHLKSQTGFLQFNTNLKCVIRSRTGTLLRAYMVIPRHRHIINISYWPSARAVLGEYRPEVLTVRTERSKVLTIKTEGWYSPSTVPSKLGK